MFKLISAKFFVQLLGVVQYYPRLINNRHIMSFVPKFNYVLSTKSSPIYKPVTSQSEGCKLQHSPLCHREAFAAGIVYMDHPIMLKIFFVFHTVYWCEVL